MGDVLETQESDDKVSATIEQFDLVSIGEGMVQLNTELKYSITKGQLSLFEVDVDDRLKILNVEGPRQIPVKRWDVQTISMVDPENGKDEEEPKKANRKKRILRVWLEYGMEDEYNFTVRSEFSMNGTSDKITLPRWNGLSEDIVSRHKGFIAIEARTNVEVQEICSRGTATMDVSEIPSTLKSKARFPVLLGYKYLFPQHTIELNVKKHADVGVLIAVIDSALYSCTVSAEGRRMYQLLLQCRNTTQQYLRMKLPERCEIWSSTVNGQTVKPAKDVEKQELMIPLLKQSTVSNDSSFPIEIVYTENSTRGSEMVSYGEIMMQFPVVRLPISKLFVQVILPNNYKYGEFSGMQEVPRFSSAPPGGDAVHQVERYQVHSQSNMMMQNVRYDNNPMFDESLNMPVSESTKVGVLPVKVQVPMDGGKRFYFEQLMVVGGSVSNSGELESRQDGSSISLKVKYKKEEKSWWSKRSVGYGYSCNMV